MMRIVLLFLALAITLQSAPKSVGYLTLEMDRPIDQSTYTYVKFALEHFRKEKCSCVILHLNTPGGELFSAKKIADELEKMDYEYQIPVIAFVKDWALSAGAMLAYSCRYIAVSKNALMGAAEPIMQQNGEIKTASEKILSALRAEFHSLAKSFDRNPYLAEAMVDKDVILVERDGEIRKVDSVQKEDVVLSQKGKLLTLTKEELIKLGIAGFEANEISSLPFFEEEPNLIAYSHWKIAFFTFLSHPLLQSMLASVLLLSIFMEINAPSGFFAALGAVSFGLILFSNAAVYAVDWLEIIFIILGAICILLEIFILPTFGVVGVLGLLLSLLGFSLLYFPEIKAPDFSWNLSLSFYSALHRFSWFLGGIIIAGITMYVLSRVLIQRVSFFSHLIHRGEQEGYKAQLKVFFPLKDEGVAHTPLKPTGKVLIKGELYDAKSEEGFIDKGQKIMMIRIHNNQAIVRKL